MGNFTGVTPEVSLIDVNNKTELPSIDNLLSVRVVSTCQVFRVFVEIVLQQV